MPLTGCSFQWNSLIFLCTTENVQTWKRKPNKQCGSAILHSQIGLGKNFKVLYIRRTWKQPT